MAGPGVGEMAGRRAGKGVGAPRRGFTLIEVVVAILLLEVGLGAVVGTGWLAARTLMRALELERATSAAAEVADSLAGEGAAGDGRRQGPRGRVEWWVRGEAGTGLRRARIRVVGSGDREILVVEAVLPGVGPEAVP